MTVKNKILKKKCIDVKVVITDVDGVLTDGGMFYSTNGEMLKKFNTRDGMGVEILRNNNIPVIIMTRENSKIVINGDPSQIDLPHKNMSGLNRSKKLLGHLNEISVVDFDHSDVVRHPLVSKIVKAYADQEND